MLAFTGDTGYVPAIADHVRGASLLIHDTAMGPDRTGWALARERARAEPPAAWQVVPQPDGFALAPPATAQQNEGAESL